MTSTTLLHLYDTALRGGAEFSAAAEVERDGPVIVGRYPGGRGFVVHEPTWDAPAGDVARAARRALEPLLADPTTVEVEWKTAAHDPVQPALHDTLLGLGLAPGEPEAVMIGRAADVAVDIPLPAGVAIRRITEEADVRAMSAMADAVFGDPPSDRHANALLHRLRREAGEVDAMQLWVAELDADPGADEKAGHPGARILAAGRVEPVPGTPVAGLWGGCTRPEWRGRGLYRALTAVRARQALALGREFLHSDCTEYSRPILARAGFERVTTTVPYTWERPATRG